MKDNKEYKKNNFIVTVKRLNLIYFTGNRENVRNMYRNLYINNKYKTKYLVKVWSDYKNYRRDELKRR